ncbi:hypothetical protein COT75_01670 [Candidatus Beckwithbacteria bacterium CG10_big_fil_rev_8_21_14_0_10_34_10]|uniref:Glycosyltransferase RgtA/B/C/D-like domain-containing protein n=1 Tax=Candidatus Beckwithbacteria bacterium CG10_big_fil_rev_8_21_14_0_10_34_10 TaxID=1974495 RepID=A0A2H0W9M5_9BACT|nr:MAG: hypothetical protein COT75_01670 [Candidatus Beckwithbacteria bacterium CG10_big_fil_rev_8_21_14_0_10_34_10]
MKFINNWSKFKNNFFLFLILLLAFFLLGKDINEPFWGQHEFNNVFYSNIAKNYLRYGFLETKLGQVTNYGVVSAKDFTYHTYHPSLYPILLALFFKIFGIFEWSARLLSIIFSLLFLFLVNLILKNIYQIKQGFLYLLLAIFTPLFLYYARLPVFEPIIAPFILLTVYLYFIWRKKQKKKYFVLILLSLFVCQMIEWPGFYLSLILVGHYLIFPLKKSRIFFGICLFALSAGSFLLIVGHQYLLTGEIYGGLASSFVRRVKGLGGHQPFTLLQLFRLELSRARSFLTSTVLFLSLFWLLNYFKELIKRKKISSKDHFLILFLIFGLLHLVIFPNIAWYHDYMLYYLFPPILLTASLGLKKIYSYAPGLKPLILAVILVLIYGEKKQFLHDLRNLDHHVKCVIWGQEIKKGLRKPVIELESYEDVSICPPFTQFYADQPVEFRLKEK